MFDKNLTWIYNRSAMNFKLSRHAARLTKNISDLRRMLDEMAELLNDLSRAAKASHFQGNDPTAVGNLVRKRAAKDGNGFEWIIQKNAQLAEMVDRLAGDIALLGNACDRLESDHLRYKTLYELYRALADEEANFAELGELASETLARILHAEYGTLEILGRDQRPRLVHEVKGNGDRLFPSELKEKATQAVLESGSVVIMTHPIGGKRSGNGRQTSLVCSPLKSDGRVVGTLLFGGSRQSLAVDQTEILECVSQKLAARLSKTITPGQDLAWRQRLEELRRRYDFGDLIGVSDEIARVMSTIALVAETDSTVLIEGESGTGKEVVAYAIHRNSRRKDAAFIPINCSAIPETLLESELFGYEKGAFTGAVSRKPGKFELADGGTILLDEIGELSMSLQVKLLRFLQSHEFEPLGSNKLLKSDVRIIAATKRDLMKMVGEEKFRDDLFYRINVINIKVPPLRQRLGDVAPLTEHFIRKYNEKSGKEIDGIDDEALACLEEYDFPGNVRELENLIERAVVMCRGTKITLDDLPDEVRWKAQAGGGYLARSADQLRLLRRKLVEESLAPVEKSFVLRALKKSGGNVSEAARLTHMHRRQFQRLMKRHGVKIGDQKTNSGQDATSLSHRSLTDLLGRG